MQHLKIVRGTSASIGIELRDESGNVVTLESGEFLRFGVKRNARDTSYIIESTTTTAVGDYYVVSLEPSDTASLNFGRYYYDVGLQSCTDYYMVV